MSCVSQHAVVQAGCHLATTCRSADTFFDSQMAVRLRFNRYWFCFFVGSISHADRAGLTAL